MLAIVDELSQLFLVYRAFTLQDLFMSLVGITLAYLGYTLFKRLTITTPE